MSRSTSGMSAMPMASAKMVVGGVRGRMMRQIIPRRLALFATAAPWSVDEGRLEMVEPDPEDACDPAEDRGVVEGDRGAVPRLVEEDDRSDDRRGGHHAAP